jgi:hypothetical protein
MALEILVMSKDTHKNVAVLNRIIDTKGYYVTVNPFVVTTVAKFRSDNFLALLK